MRPRSMSLGCVLLVSFFTSASVFAESAAASPAASPVKNADRRHLAVEDMLRFSIIGDPGSLGWTDHYTRQTATYSPDGQYAAVVVRRGILERGTIEGRLLLYRVADLMQNAQPRILATFESSTNGQPIGMVRWLDDDTLIFGASSGETPTQVFRLTVASGELMQLTNEPTQVLWYDITASADRLVVVRQMPKALSMRDDPECLQHGCRVTARSFRHAERDQKTWADFATDVVVHDLREGTRRAIEGPFQRDPDVDRCMLDQFESGMSPDGRYGIFICDMFVWPDWWREYRDSEASMEPASSWPLHTAQRFIYDLDAGSFRKLNDAPYNFGGVALWIDGGRELVLAGATETLQGTSGAERARRASDRAVLLIDPQTDTVRRIARLPENVRGISNARWDEKRRTLVVEMKGVDGERLSPLAWRRSAGKWSPVAVPTSVPATAAVAVELVVEESLNTRPVLVARHSKTGVKKEVLDPNAWMDDIRLGKVEEIHWDTPDKRTWRGRLYYPPNYAPGRRYGLLVQTHGISSDQFSLDGYARNYAAQPVAARGLIVLQVEERYASVVATPLEWTTVQAGYEAAIAHLDAIGLIDPKRVGILGWSRSGNHVGYTLVHSEFPFAAAMLMDANDFGWWTYISWGVHRHIEDSYGTAPFGEGLTSWLNSAPSFQLVRVQTPMLIWRANTLYGLWEWVGGLRRLGRPVEQWFFPDGEHDLFKLGHRRRANTLLVDWFDFWLNGHEDPDPAKREQYQRWRQFRAQQERVIAEPRAPLLKWSATPSTSVSPEGAPPHMSRP